MLLTQVPGRAGLPSAALSTVLGYHDFTHAVATLTSTQHVPDEHGALSLAARVLADAVVIRVDGVLVAVAMPLDVSVLVAAGTWSVEFVPQVTDPHAARTLAVLSVRIGTTTER